MSSVSPFLVKRPNSKNLHPISIRIIKDRKPSYLYLGQAIKLNQWDSKNGRVKNSHPDYLEINQLIISKLSKANKSLLNAEIKEEHLSSKKIKKQMVSNNESDFFKVAKAYLKNIENRKKFHQLDIETRRVEVFKEFLKKDKLFFTEINIELIMEFENFLLSKRNLSRRTVINYMITIRTVFNLAITNCSADVKLYPFGKGKYPIKFPETQKIGLNMAEITALENVEDLTKAQEYALSAWLLSFYFAGIRVSDVLQLKWKDFIDDRLYYRMDKNSKLVSLKVPDKVFKILNKLERNDDSVFLFKELEGVDINDNRFLRTRIKTATRNFNRRLELIAEKAGIDKKMSMHIARHSFGNISGDKIPIQMLQRLYRHSSVTTTIMYQSNFLQKDTDEALDKVINF
ncbi:site-specific recombinase XerD [Mariniflexile fucanivorans]|uniref:Site-specific recombinase XerD n=1 Tax=Mariniflexile fucanivorans TaxID=264023 RepID=A0A4R1RNP2_9FLAO|nr:site-specific integrase [Mariniflexile fucanivorans]TCL67834.1 site-specific recombinase XerD [Mariniflexile fucanivorans]